MDSLNTPLLNSPKSLTSGLKKTASLMLASLVLVGGTFFAEIKGNSVQGNILEYPSVKQVKGADEVFLDSHRVVRNSNPKDPFVFSVSSNQSKTANIEFTSGKIWLNTQNSIYNTEVKVGGYKLLIPPSISSIERKDGVTTFEVIARIAQVQIATQTIFVPQGKGVVLYDAKLKNSQKEIDQIRLSKLYKEFALYSVAQKDAWYATNIQKDVEFKEQLLSDLKNALRTQGARVSSSPDSLVESFRSIGTTVAEQIAFSEDKKNDYIFADASRYFDTALYLFQIGKTDEAQQMLSRFKVQIQEHKDVLQPHVLQLRDVVAISTFGDQLYPAYTAVNELSDLAVFDSLVFKLSQLFDVLRMGASPEQEDFLVAVMNRLAADIQKNVSLLNEKQALSLSEVIHSVLTDNAKLMREPYFRALSLIQDAAIKKATTRDSTTDTQQYFISQKLEEMRAIKKQLDAKKIDFQQARVALVFLAQTVEATKPLLSDSAFLPYFEEQYKDFVPFIAFLKSTDAQELHGSFNDDYVEYKEKVTEANYIQSLLNAATGGEALSSIDREQRASRAAVDLRQTGLTNVQLAFDSVEGSSVIVISDALFDGAHFAARYDVEGKLFTDVVYDTKPVINGIRLDNLRTFLLVSRGKVALPNNQGLEALTVKPVTDENAKVRATIEVLKKNLSIAGITVDDKYIDTTRYNDGLIKVLLATRGTDTAQKLFSFEISTDLLTASRLEVQTVLGQIPANDSFSLKELAYRVDQIFERAAFEKAKEGELQKITPAGE